VSFTVEDIGSGCWAINDAGRSVAYVTSQGYVDWLLKSPLEDGPRLTALRKETHLCYTLGLKLLLFPPHPCEALVEKRWELLDGGRRLRLTGISRAEEGRFEADLIWFDVVLNGKGTAWVTDVEVDLQDSSRRRSARRATATSGAVQGAGVHVA